MSRTYESHWAINSVKVPSIMDERICAMSLSMKERLCMVAKAMARGSLAAKRCLR